MRWIESEKIFRGRQIGLDSRSVSPVISVILMVAVVVILAATISTFVLGLGESASDPGPSATFEAEQKSHQTVVFTVLGGDTIDADNLDVSSGQITDAPEKVQAGDKIRVDPIRGSDGKTDPTAFGEFSLVWATDDGQDTKVLETITVEPAVPDVTGNGNPPTDTNGDGLLDDVAGTGQLEIEDPGAISDYVVSNGNDKIGEFPEYFNFNCVEPAKVKINDATALNDQLNGNGSPNCEGPA